MPWFGEDEDRARAAKCLAQQCPKETSVAESVIAGSGECPHTHRRPSTSTAPGVSSQLGSLHARGPMSGSTLALASNATALPAPENPTAAAASPPAAGCCFSFGYGSLMKPCCLETERTSDVSTCRRAQGVIGGGS